MTRKLIPIALILAAATLARADFNPVPLTPSSFTQDIVVEKSAQAPLENFTTVTVDQGTNNYGNTFFEQGWIEAYGWEGLPPHGSFLTATNVANHIYQMPPDYTVNNVGYIGSQTCITNALQPVSILVTQSLSVTLTATNPAAYSALSVLYAGGGAGTVAVTVNHQDGTQEPTSFASYDWFNTTQPAVFCAAGRVQLDGALNTLNSTSQTKLFNADITLGDVTSPVTSVTFTMGAAGNFRVFVFAISGATDGINFTNPIGLSGFNGDAVVETAAPLNMSGAPLNVDICMDTGGPLNNGNTWFEMGLFGGTGTNGAPATKSGSLFCGMPHPGQTITAGIYSFTMAPNYHVPHSVYIGNFGAGFYTNGPFGTPNYKNGSFTITNPTPLQAISILGAAGSGPCVMSTVLNYNDGSQQTTSLSIADWFSGSTGVWVCEGRITVSSRAVQNIGTTSACRLWNNNITLTNTAASVTNIAFTYTSGGRCAMFAVSGQPVSGGNFTPLGVTGYNARTIVPADQPYYTGPFNATTATMDNGVANTGNTWYEMGWVTNGPASASGLPPAGSILTALTSAAGNMHYYQMPATYKGPNAVLIDTNHQIANITPASPANYGAFSLLTAGASIGAANSMSNYCVLQHADGTQETNAFFGYDWFNDTYPPAFISNGRCQTSYGNAENLWNNPQNPRLFETYFAVNNPNSPVTNIVVGYGHGGAANWTTYVLAVSAGAGAPPQPPLILPNPASVTTYEGSNATFTAGISGGTTPISVQWQIGTNGVFVPLANGGQIGGALSPSLVISNVNFGNMVGSYELIASNAVGMATSSVATLTVLSGYTNVVQVADTNSDIVIYQGSSPAAEQAYHAIDRLVGTDPGKYLNSGLNGGVPFQGPVGFIVNPMLGSTVLKGLRFYTANDAEERDPTSYLLEGSNDGGITWNTVATNAITLPSGRNNAASGAINPLTQNLTESRFYGNTTPYSSYRLSIETVKNAAGGVATAANSMQFGEVEMLGIPNPVPPTITVQPATNIIVYVGGNPHFSVAATGPGTLTYQWYTNGTAIANATNNTFTFMGAQMANSGLSFNCIVSNVYGPTPSTACVLQVIAAPTTPYPVAVIADKPIAFWRLDEPDDANGNQGVVANDYIGGYDGMYTNTILQVPGYDPTLDADTAAQFGSWTLNDSAVENITGIAFTTPTNTDGAFSVEAWVNASQPATAGAGIVSAGYGGGGEQFAIDCGGTGNALRFYFRDASTASHVVTGTNVLTIGTWYHVAAVLDAAHSNEFLYVDGQLVAKTTLAAKGLGVRTPTTPLSIGARSSILLTNYNLQFQGTIDEVAIYNYALSSNQVLNHYYGSDPAPAFTITPTNTTVSEGATGTFYSLAYGPGTLHYQWYASDGFSYTNLLVNQTNHNLILSNVSYTLQNQLYYVIEVSGTTGTAIAAAQLSVYQGPPQILSPTAPQIIYAVQGGTVIMSATAGGTLPFTYQWQSSVDGSTWVNLADGGRISGSHTNVLTIGDVQTTDGPYYQLGVNNAYTGGNPVNTPEFQLVFFGTSPINFQTNGFFWTMQNVGGNATTIANNVLTLTESTGSSAHSAFFNAPLYIGNFLATFVYQDLTIGGADGAAFVLQNDPRGPTAIGGGGGSLGVSGITPSAELEFNIYAGGGENVGMAFNTNGVTGAGGANGNYTPTTPVNVASGDPIMVSVRYAYGTVSITLTDTNTSPASVFTTNIVTGDLTALLGGDTALVGFTGADGGTVSSQTITGFNYFTYPELYSQVTSTNTIVFSWQPEIGNFTLQSKASLTSGTWSNVGTQPTYVNGRVQVVVPIVAPGNEFYRLSGQQ